MNTNENSAHSFTEGSDSGTLKFSKPTPNFPKGGEEIKDGEFVSSVKEETKHNTLNDIKDRIAKEEGFKNWTELTWEVNYTSYELLWGKVANELVKENQELKAERDYWFYQAKNNTVNTELLEALENAKTVIEVLSTDTDTVLMKQIESAINKARNV